LTPAYYLCPQNRIGREASQAMLIAENKRLSKLSICLEAAHIYLLSEKEAIKIIEHQLITIGNQWQIICDEAKLKEIDQNYLFGHQFFNPSVFEDLNGHRSCLKDIAENFLKKIH
jgi:serine/threonine-protein kinase HipA